ncbi:hypothetical protein PAL_GLEAN10002350 [Pteropus alecto]|uniref:CD99 antigen n=1 Tax=Pteropus alecto TaxID=9402 RepID=L5KBF6_PTEAL|nr:hypothetical protein PAL_GLEAN10002350 [Pteropus alecto]
MRPLRKPRCLAAGGGGGGGGGGGDGDGDQRRDGKDQDDAPGVVPGIIGAVVVAVAGAISSFIAYQKKKFCFKENGWAANGGVGGEFSMLSLPAAAVTSTCQLHGRDSSHVTALHLAAGCVYRSLGLDPVKPFNRLFWRNSRCAGETAVDSEQDDKAGRLRLRLRRMPAGGQSPPRPDRLRLDRLRLHRPHLEQPRLEQPRLALPLLKLDSAL